MTSVFRMPAGKKMQSTLACVDLDIELAVCQFEVVIEITLNGQCINRTVCGQSHCNIHCEFDDSVSSVNGKFEISLRTNPHDHWATAQIKSLKVHQIDITHMLPHLTVTTERAVSLPMDKPIWVWMVSHWSLVLPEAHALYRSLIRS